MTGHPFQVRTWADLPRGIVAAEQVGALGLAHLLRALAAGRIACLPLLPECSATYFKQFARRTRNKPAVVLVGDDDYASDAGPERWRVAERAIRWAAGVMVHAAGAEIAHYEAAITAAETCGRVLVIECATADVNAWLALAARAPNRPRILLIVPQNGGAHPIAPPRARLQ